MSNNENTNNEKSKYFVIYFTDFLKGLRKFWWICVILALILGGGRFFDGYTSYVPLYTSSATFTISTQSNQSTISGISSYSFYYDASTASQLTDTFPYILKSNILQEAMCNDMDVEYLPASISASSVPGSNLFTLSATGKDPQKTYDVLLSAIENYPDAAKYVVGNIKFEMIETPAVASVPSNKHNYISNTFEGAAIGIIIGVFIILLYAVMRKTIRTKDDIKRELNLEAIGFIPRVVFKKYVSEKDRRILFSNEKIDSDFLEAYRVLRNVFISSVAEKYKTVLITSTAPGEGKTTTAVNLALSLVSLGKKILLVDSDVHHPSVIDTVDVAKESTKLLKTIIPKTGDITYKLVRASERGLDIMTLSAQEEKKDINLDFSNLKNILNTLKNDYDYILIDTPPCGLVSDAMYIAEAAEAAVYVIHQDLVRISKIRSGIDNLISTDIQIVGCILNGAETASSGYGYGYGYSYGYGYGYGYGKRHNYGEKHHKSKKEHNKKVSKK